MRPAVARLFSGLLLAVAWLILAAITASALLERGFSGALATFAGDFAYPWRAQFYTDFSLHVLLAAAWIAWRAQTKLLGLALAVAAIILGMLFTIPYLLVAWASARGDIRQLLLGRHRQDLSVARGTRPGRVTGGRSDRGRPG